MTSFFHSARYIIIIECLNYNRTVRPEDSPSGILRYRINMAIPKLQQHQSPGQSQSQIPEESTQCIETRPNPTSVPTGGNTKFYRRSSIKTQSKTNTNLRKIPGGTSTESNRNRPCFLPNTSHDRRGMEDGRLRTASPIYPRGNTRIPPTYMQQKWLPQR